MDMLPMSLKSLVRGGAGREMMATGARIEYSGGCFSRGARRAAHG
jgi:hypothetical protein